MGEGAEEDAVQLQSGEAAGQGDEQGDAEEAGEAFAERAED